MASAIASTKLTLRLPDSLIERAKSFSQLSGKSVTQIVADYFSSLPAPEAANAAEPLPPLVASLYGLLKGVQVDEDDYHQYLEQKYL
jgi:hypothetical protein